jgi:outer membrane immunogenic protein
MRNLIGSVFFLISISVSLAQAPPGKGGQQLNAGFGLSGWGVPIYVGLDFGVHDEITVGPRISFRNYTRYINGRPYDQNLMVLGVSGNYHFNRLLELPSNWNCYAGLSLGYYAWSAEEWPGARSSQMGLDIQVGGRYFFNKSTGINLEFGGGTGASAIFGITHRF